MDRILWIGPRHPPSELKVLLSTQGTEVSAFEDLEVAIRSTGGLPISVAVLSADVREILASIPKLATARPEVPILAVTEVGVAPQVTWALRAGALGVIDLRSQKAVEIAHQVKLAVERFHQSSRERELLLRLRSLNEDFLKNIVSLEKKNIELEEALHTESENLGGPEEGPARVLIVDDEETVCQVLQMVLQKKGHTYETAMTGEAAIEAIKKGPAFNVVITDKNLPGISGLDVLREAKRAAPDTDIIMMTGYSSMEAAVEALNLGASAYLEKPFEHIKVVLEKIEGVVNKQRTRQRKRHYLHVIKERNRSFLDQYKAIRADLEAWLQNRGLLPGKAQE